MNFRDTEEDHKDVMMSGRRNGEAKRPASTLLTSAQSHRERKIAWEDTFLDRMS